PFERGALLTGRRDRAAEPQRPDAWWNAEAQGAAPRRSEHVPPFPSGVLAPAHPASVGRARLRMAPRSAGRRARLGETAAPPLSKTELELNEFRDLYRIPKFQPKKFEEGELVRAVIG